MVSLGRFSPCAENLLLNSIDFTKHMRLFVLRQSNGLFAGHILYTKLYFNLVVSKLTVEESLDG